MQKTHLYLVPGFFGFANIGDFAYFAHVAGGLQAAFEERGLDVDIHVVATRPTASLGARAAKLAETIAATSTQDASVHLVGHSTGGLDARLLVHPGVQLPTDVDPEPIARRVRSIVSLATPHRGAPLATALSTVQGQELMRVLSLSAILAIRNSGRTGSVLAKVAAAIPRRVVPAGLIEQIHADLIQGFSPDRRRHVDALLSDVASDPSLMVQLRPEGVDLINLVARPRDGVARGSIVTGTRPPSLGTTISAGLSIGHQASHNLFKQMHRMAGRLPDPYRPHLDDHDYALLQDAGDHFVADVSNDGMVPVRSQVWGELLGAWTADHLDIIGHFEEPDTDPPHRDWMFSGSNFRHAQFAEVCATVADFVVKHDR